MAKVPDLRCVCSKWLLTGLLLSLFDAVEAVSMGVASWLEAVACLHEWLGWKEGALRMGLGLAALASMLALWQGLKGIAWRAVDTESL